MKKGKIQNLDGVELPNEKTRKLQEKGKFCKYLGVQEADEIMVNEMKDKVKKEYYRKMREVLETGILQYSQGGQDVNQSILTGE